MALIDHRHYFWNKHIYISLSDEDPIAGFDGDGEMSNRESEDESEATEPIESGPRHKYDSSRRYPDERYHEKPFDRRREGPRGRRSDGRNGHFQD